MTVSDVTPSGVLTNAHRNPFHIRMWEQLVSIDRSSDSLFESYMNEWTKEDSVDRDSVVAALLKASQYLYDALNAEVTRLRQILSKALSDARDVNNIIIDPQDYQRLELCFSWLYSHWCDNFGGPLLMQRSMESFEHRPVLLHVMALSMMRALSESIHYRVVTVSGDKTLLRVSVDAQLVVRILRNIINECDGMFEDELPMSNAYGVYAYFKEIPTEELRKLSTPIETIRNLLSNVLYIPLDYVSHGALPILERYKTEDDSAVVDGSSILPKGIRHERPTLLISHIFLHRSRGKHLNNEELSFIDGIITEWRRRFNSGASVKKEEDEDEAAGTLRPSKKYGYVYELDGLLRTMISQDYKEIYEEAFIATNVSKQEEEEEAKPLFQISATHGDEKEGVEEEKEPYLLSGHTFFAFVMAHTWQLLLSLDRYDIEATPESRGRARYAYELIAYHIVQLMIGQKVLNPSAAFNADTLSDDDTKDELKQRGFIGLDVLYERSISSSWKQRDIIMHRMTHYTALILMDQVYHDILHVPVGRYQTTIMGRAIRVLPLYNWTAFNYGNKNGLSWLYKASENMVHGLEVALKDYLVDAYSGRPVAFYKMHYLLLVRNVKSYVSNKYQKIVASSFGNYQEYVDGYLYREIDKFSGVVGIVDTILALAHRRYEDLSQFSDERRNMNRIIREVLNKKGIDEENTKRSVMAYVVDRSIRLFRLARLEVLYPYTASINSSSSSEEGERFLDMEMASPLYAMDSEHSNARLPQQFASIRGSGKHLSQLESSLLYAITVPLHVELGRIDTIVNQDFRYELYEGIDYQMIHNTNPEYRMRVAYASRLLRRMALNLANAISLAIYAENKAKNVGIIEESYNRAFFSDQFTVDGENKLMLHNIIEKISPLYNSYVPEARFYQTGSEESNYPVIHPVDLYWYDRIVATMLQKEHELRPDAQVDPSEFPDSGLLMAAIVGMLQNMLLGGKVVTAPDKSVYTHAENAEFYEHLDTADSMWLLMQDDSDVKKLKSWAQYIMKLTDRCREIAFAVLQRKDAETILYGADYTLVLPTGVLVPFRAFASFVQYACDLRIELTAVDVNGVTEETKKFTLFVYDVINHAADVIDSVEVTDTNGKRGMVSKTPLIEVMMYDYMITNRDTDLVMPRGVGTAVDTKKFDISRFARFYDLMAMVTQRGTAFNTHNLFFDDKKALFSLKKLPNHVQNKERPLGYIRSDDDASNDDENNNDVKKQTVKGEEGQEEEVYDVIKPEKLEME